MGKYDNQNPDYIQWYLEPDEMKLISANFITQNYNSAKKHMTALASFDFYKTKILNKFNNSQEYANKYYNISRNLVNNEKFQQALNASMKQLQLPALTNRALYVEEIRNELKNNIDKFEELTSQISQAISAIMDVFGNEDYEEIQALGYQKKNRIISQQDYENMGAYKGQYERLLSYLPEFQNILKSDKVTDNTLAILSKMLGPIQTLIGICNEFVITEQLNKLVQYFVNDFQNIQGLEIKRVGSDNSTNSQEFKVQTADVAFIFNQNNAEGRFSLPDLGISLKRSSKKLSEAEQVNVKLKGTNLGKLMNEIDPRLVTAFYTLYANTRPTIGGKRQNAIPAGLLPYSYVYMKTQILVPALIGNINSKELVSVFVINDKAYTIYDLLEKLSTQSINKVMTMKPAFSTKHSAIVNQHKSFFNPLGRPETRSHNIRKEIDKISMNIYLTLKLKEMSR